ncbi:MAG: hypothetical protein ABI609_05175 [Acidobacteriota bacterium]
MNDQQFEYLVQELSSARRFTEATAETLRQHFDESTGTLRSELRQHVDESGALLRRELRLHLDESGVLLRRELRQHVDESAGMLRDELRRHFDVVAEDLRSDLRLVAEGVAMVDAKTERQIEALRLDMISQSAETRAMLKLSYVDLERRLSTLEARP